MNTVTVNLDNLSESARVEVLRSIRLANGEAAFSGVKDGETFSVADMEFIKFPSVNGMTPVVMKEIAFFSRFGNNNDLRSSDVLQRMVTEILPKIIADVGEENVCNFETDLTTLDGLKTYGVMKSKISLPTLDFYRANAEIFGKYKLDRYFFLATPDSTQPNDDPRWILCVAPSGDVDFDFCHFNFSGVRPILYLKSSIFGSHEA